jgi:dipeptide/tripeptide permease
MLEFFRDGGWGMYPTILFGFTLVAAGFLYLFRPESRYVSIVFCTGFLTVGSGVLGTVTGLVTTFRYLQHVPPVDQLKIAALGTAESLNNIVLALIIAIVAALPTLGGVIRSVRRVQPA